MQNQIPQNDEDVEKFIDSKYSNAIIADCIKGIYKCKRATGHSILDSLKHAFEAHLEVHSDNFKIPEDVTQTIVEVDPHEIEEAVVRLKEKVALDNCPVKIDIHFVFDRNTFENVVMKDPDFEAYNSMFKVMEIFSSNLPELVILISFGGCQKLPEAIHKIVDLLKSNKLNDFPWHVYIVEIDKVTKELKTRYDIGRVKGNRRHPQ